MGREEGCGAQQAGGHFEKQDARRVVPSAKGAGEADACTFDESDEAGRCERGGSESGQAMLGVDAGWEPGKGRSVARALHLGA
eukprot:85419-Pleurochrysis_carterae.AAC.1